MNARFLSAGLVFLVIPMLPAMGQNRVISMVGHWHVDFARSSDPWALQHPKSVMLDVAVDNKKAYEATETIVGADGKLTTETIRAAYNGKPYPVSGSPFDVTVAMTHLPGGSSQTELLTPDGLRALIVCSVSGDLNTMICDGNYTNAKGVSEAAKSVYVRD